MTASRAPASVSHPIRDELFPKLDRARSIHEIENVIHDAGEGLSWLGHALYADHNGEQLVREAAARVIPRMLDDRGARSCETSASGHRQALVIAAKWDATQPELWPADTRAMVAHEVCRVEGVGNG